jgi:tetratricopeptide (TPR) repeat protein
MAQINKDTGSNTQPTLMKESNKPEVQSASINEDRDVDHPSPLVSETMDLSGQSSVVSEDTEFPAINSNYRLSAEDIFSVALEKAQAGDLEKALSLWQEVVNIEPDFAPAWHNLGSAYAYLNRLTEAIESFDKALAININDHLSWNDRGNALFRLKKWQEAIISWDRVIGIKPDFEQAWYHRGLALEKLEEYAEAMISYKKCLNINPNFKQAQKRYQKLRLNTVIVGAGKREKASVKKRFTNHNWNNSRQEV